MPEAKTVHWHPFTTEKDLRCGLPFKEGREWRTDIKDVTCNNCIRTNHR